MSDGELTGLKAQAAAGVKWTAASSAITISLQALQLTVLARLLSPEEFGLMAMVMVVVGFVQAYADAGISAAIIHRQDVTSEQLSSLYWLNILSGVLAFGIAWLITPLVVLFYREPRLVPLLHMTALTFLIVPFGKQFEILLQKEMRFNWLSKLQIVAIAVGVTTAISLAMLGQGVWALVWGLLSQEAVRTVLLVLVGRRRHRPTFHFARRDLDGYLSFGLYQMGERSINFLAQRTDQLLLGSLLGAQALGYYNFALNLAIQPISKINPIVTRVAFPLFAQVQDDTRRLRQGYLKIVSLLTAVNAPILVGLAAVAPRAVPLIFGEKWIDAVDLVQILACVALLRSIGNPIGSLLLAKGRAGLGFTWNTVLFSVSIPAIYLGAKLGDARGVALALAGLQLALQVPAYVYLVYPLTGKEGVMLYVQAVLRPVARALLMGAGVLLAGTVISQVWVAMVVQVSVGIGLYMILLWLFDRGQLTELGDMLLGMRRPRVHSRAI